MILDPLDDDEDDNVPTIKIKNPYKDFKVNLYTQPERVKNLYMPSNKELGKALIGLGVLLAIVGLMLILSK